MRAGLMPWPFPKLSLGLRSPPPRRRWGEEEACRILGGFGDHDDDDERRQPYEAMQDTQRRQTARFDVHFNGGPPPSCKHTSTRSRAGGRTPPVEV